MLVDAKYGQVTVEQPTDTMDFDGDEPVFVLRAQDVFAVPLLARYLNLARGTGENKETHQVSPEFIEGVESVMRDFQDFQNVHADRVKIPD